MTVRHVAPQPPAESGVVDYAEALHRALAKVCDIRWDAGPGPRLYHVGNNGLHREIYRQALRDPGVVILHDAVLHHLMLGMLSESDYVEEFVYNYGAWSREQARRLYRNRARSAGDRVYFDYPMLRRLAERSLAVVVHNARAAQMVRRHCGTARLEVIPHFVELRDAAPPPRNPRPVFGVFGHLRESKRLRSFLEAARLADVEAVVAGRFVSETYERSLRPLLSSAKRLPFGSRADFLSGLAGVDAVVNLRSPSAGETSGVTLNAMSLARPAIVSAAGEALDYPAGVCAAVDEGPGEREGLAATMAWLAESRADRLIMANAARRHVAEHHAPHRVAARFLELLAGAGVF
jgi:glycosyltransferase involved in cell wall biosynthesis